MPRWLLNKLSICSSDISSMIQNLISHHWYLQARREFGYNILGCLELPIDCQSVLNSLVFDEGLARQILASGGHTVSSTSQWVRFNEHSLQEGETEWRQNLTVSLRTGHWPFKRTETTQIFQVLLPARGVPEELLARDNYIRPWVLLQYLNFTSHSGNIQTYFHYSDSTPVIV